MKNYSGICNTYLVEGAQGAEHDGMTVCFRCNNTCHEGANFCHMCGSSLEADASRLVSAGDPLIGRVLADRYRIISLIGRGGMGVVYKGEHIHMAKHVALKLLGGELAAQKDLIKRFKREADAASRLSNIHTVTIFDYGQSQGLIYLVMEHLEGRDLAAVLRKDKGLSTTRALMILAQICESLLEAHELGIVHRDLKPENIFLVEKKALKDFVKVLDFGLAKIRAGLGPPDETAHGVVLGTPYYMAPEQIRGDPIDNRSDIYSLGGLLYTMLCGHPPYMAPTPLAVMAMHLTNSVPALDCSKMASAAEKQALTSIIQKCMDKDPARRYADVASLKEDIITAAQDVASGEFTLPSMRSGSAPAASPSTTPREISTAGLKEEFDRYERMLRMRRLSYIFVPLILLGLAGWGGWYVFASLPQRPDPVEREPNNTADESNRLPLGQARSGTIGKRLSTMESDHDWYRVEIPSDHTVLDVTLDGVPNMDLMLQVFKKGHEKAFATAGSWGRGEGEILRSLAVSRGTYYILVREDLSIFGTRATENISDLYTLVAQTHPAAGWELEPNGDTKSATLVNGDGEIKGILTGKDDTDYLLVKCPALGGLTAALTGPPLPFTLAVRDLLDGSLVTVTSPSPQVSVPGSMGMEKFFISLGYSPEHDKDRQLKDLDRPYTLSYHCTPQNP